MFYLLEVLVSDVVHTEKHARNQGQPDHYHHPFQVHCVEYLHVGFSGHPARGEQESPESLIYRHPTFVPALLKPACVAFKKIVQSVHL